MRQPYDRRADVVAAAATVPNISAKHEGGDPAVEVTREHPSDMPASRPDDSPRKGAPAMMPEAMKCLVGKSLPAPAWERNLREEGRRRYLSCAATMSLRCAPSA